MLKCRSPRPTKQQGRAFPSTFRVRRSIRRCCEQGDSRRFRTGGAARVVPNRDVLSLSRISTSRPARRSAATARASEVFFADCAQEKGRARFLARPFFLHGSEAAGYWL